MWKLIIGSLLTLCYRVVVRAKLSVICPSFWIDFNVPFMYFKLIFLYALYIQAYSTMIVINLRPEVQLKLKSIQILCVNYFSTEIKSKSSASACCDFVYRYVDIKTWLSLKRPRRDLKLGKFDCCWAPCFALIPRQLIYNSWSIRKQANSKPTQYKHKLRRGWERRVFFRLSMMKFFGKWNDCLIVVSVVALR